MKHINSVALVLVFAILLSPNVQVAMAVVTYVVGGGDVGWDFAPHPSYYSDWATQNYIFPGDVLNFKYDPTEHNDLQVSLSDYSTCNTSHPRQQYKSGDNVVTVPKPGTYYFTCGFNNHCSEASMIMKVAVGARAGCTPQLEPPPPPPNHLPPPHHSPPAMPPADSSTNPNPQSPSPASSPLSPPSQNTPANSTFPPPPAAQSSPPPPTQKSNPNFTP